MWMRQVEAIHNSYLQMFVEVQGVRFPIPFNTITFSEQQLIEKIIDCRNNSKYLIGQAKMPDRQIVILLSYLISTFIDIHGTFNQLPITDNFDKQRDEDTPKIVYLCKGEKRRQQLLRIAQRVYDYVNRTLVKERGQTLFELESDTLYETRAIFKIWEGRSEEEKELEELAKSGKVALLRRLYFMPIRKFMESKLKKKEDAFWKKCYEYGFDTEIKDHYNFIKKVDLLFMETNDLEGIIQDFMTANLFEVHLHRANIEYRKLDKYYNYRQEEARKPKSTSTNHFKIPTKRDAEAHRQTANQYKKDKARKGEAEAKKKGERPTMDRLDKAKPDKNGESKLQGHDSSDSKIQEQKMEEGELIIDRSIDKKQKPWSIALLDRKFNELYIQKKSMLQNTRTGYSNTQRLMQDYLDCYYLMNLQTIGYLISWLLIEWANEKFHENSDNSQNFINYIYSKTLLSSIVLRKLKRNFLAFVKKSPPKLQGTELSFVYIEEVLNFFQKLVVWHQILSKSMSKDTSGQSNEGNFDNNNRLIVFRQKVNKDSNLKVTTFDQKMFFQLLSENMKWICIMQNLAYSFDYFEHFFLKPQKLKLEYIYRCPRIMGDQCRYTIHGLIVTSTPNEEDLHIVSEKFEDIGKQMDDKKEDKELYSQIIRSYGVLIHDICELVPDGIVIYFPTREILKECRSEWEMKENIYEKINKTKHIFEESEWEQENTINITKFKKYCKIGRGAVFFVSAQSEFAKLETFYGLYSRCIVMVGVPYHLHHLQVQQKLKFMGLKDHFRFEEAMKNVNRCLSNCINSPIEMKTVVFADIAYLRSDIRKKWFPFIEDVNLNTLQVLDFISAISKKSSDLVGKKMQEQGRRVREEDTRKKENHIDFMRRINSDVSLNSFHNY